MSYVSVDKKASDVPPGELTLAKAGQALVLLSNVDGQIYATSWTCPHEGAALNYGFLEGNEVVCASHGAIFDVITGDVLSGPSDYGIVCFPVKIEGEDILVEIQGLA